MEQIETPKYYEYCIYFEGKKYLFSNRWSAIEKAKELSKQSKVNIRRRIYDCNGVSFDSTFFRTFENGELKK